MKPYNFLLIAFLTAFIILMVTYSALYKEPVKPILNHPEQQKIYRWCEGRYYLLKDYNHQVIVGEVKFEEVDKEEGIIFYGNCKL